MNPLFEVWKNDGQEGLEGFLELAPVMMHSTNRDRRLEWVSTLWASTLGYTPDEMIGRCLPDFLTEESRQRAEKVEIPRFLRTGRVHNVEYEAIRKDGTVLPILLSSLAHRDEDGTFANSLAVIADNTANKYLEMFEKKAMEAERANQAKSRFLANVSHEIRTPLNAIVGFGEMVAGRGGAINEAKKVEYAGHIVDSGTRLSTLINRVLDLSEIEAGQHSLSIETVQPEKPIQAALGQVGILAQKRGVNLSYDTCGKALPLINADSDRLVQALVNITANAIKFNSKGGYVRVFTTEDADRLRVNVEDNGPGIPEDRQEEVFEPFNRVGAETSGIEGSGLGLLLAKEYAEAMGGNLDFESVEDRGSTFWLDFPIVSDTSAVVARSEGGQTNSSSEVIK